MGGGRLGAMVFGGVERERIQFNEDSLWIGAETDPGAYQAFGDLFAETEGEGEVTAYRRELDIRRAVHTVTYERGGAACPWSMGDAAWLAQNLWDHYAFTGDREYLRTCAHPILKELCEFWEDSLIKRPDGKLVSPPSKSPEHGPIAAGNSYEQQLVYDLFTNYLEASAVLRVDADFRAQVADLRSRLLGPQIGRWGQLQEWAEDLDDPTNQRRHFSHMIAVYPGRQITPATTPELAEAAKVSMNLRGDEATGWSRAWKICVWARLHDGDRAYKILRGFIETSVMPNLLATHPPFQIDGNFGYAAGIIEMLLQSHAGEIQLLPARGGATVDIAWKDVKVPQSRITPLETRKSP